VSLVQRINEFMLDVECVNERTQSARFRPHQGALAFAKMETLVPLREVQMRADAWPQEKSNTPVSA
jgi:hypothetical protein